MNPETATWEHIFTSSYRPTGTKSFRLASSQWMKPKGSEKGFGSNGQNRSDDERRAFRPPPGYAFIQNDLEGAEAVAVALLCREGPFRDLIRLKIKPHNFMCVQLFPDKFADYLNVDTVQQLTPTTFFALNKYKDIVKRCKSLKKEYDLAKRTVHGCLTGDHEVLTDKGWIPITDWKPGTPIMTYDAARDTAQLEEPQHYTVIPDYAGTLHTITNSTGSVDITITDEHRVLYETNGNLKVCTPGHIPRGAGFPVSASAPKRADTDALLPAVVRLLAAYHSDGHLRDDGYIAFHLQKPRKRFQLQALLSTMDDDYRMCHNTDGTVTYTLSAQLSCLLADQGKPLSWDVLRQWSHEYMRLYIEEYAKWDGHESETAIRLSTTNKQQADLLFTMARLCGLGSTLLTIERDETRQTIYNIGINRRTRASYSSCTHRTQDVENTAVYCFTVSTSYFYVRRRKCIMITGNSNYSMGWKTFRDNVLKETQGRVLLTAAEAKRMLRMYFELFPEVHEYQIMIEEAMRLGLPVRNLFGHQVRLVQRFTTDLVRLAISWGPQSTVGQCTNLASVEILRNIRDHRRKWHLHNVTHDSILLSAPEEEAVEASHELARAMTFEFESPIDGWKATIGVERQIGHNWGKYDEEENPTGLKAQ
jgi:hypothetical protein